MLDCSWGRNSSRYSVGPALRACSATNAARALRQPSSGLGPGHRAAAMPLQLTDDLGPAEPSSLIAAAVLSLIFQRTFLSSPDQIAGAGAHQKLGHRSGRRVQPTQPGALSGGGKVRRQAGG